MESEVHHTQHIPAFDPEMAEILESFIVESREIMEKLGQDLLLLETHPTDAELHNVIFRAVHTLKGTSSFLGFEQLTELAHRFEDVLNKIRKNELQVISAMIDVMLEGYDLLKILQEKIETRDVEKLDISIILVRLEKISRGEFIAPEGKHLVEILQEETIEEHATNEQKISDQIPSDEIASLRQEIVQTSASTENTAQIVVQAKPTVDSTIRVDVSRLDVLMNLVGELVIGRNRLSQIAHLMNDQYDSHPLTQELGETNSHIDFITTELQAAVMKTRMIQIAKVFNKLPRLIRELSKEMKKEIELIISGEETELDKTLIEELNDPLVHLLRNAADHGIETPEERVKAGKPAKGTVVVRALHEGNHIVISIEDNGKGMDVEFLKKAAIQKGILTPATAAEMSAQEAFKLIFAPGFSTAKKITNVSGRGVGMDVVRTNITKLKGAIEIESEIGKGSKFIIKLPLTLAIIQALLVEAKKEIFCIPLESVIEVVRTMKGDIKTIRGKETIRLRDTVLPLIRLTNILYTKFPKDSSDASQRDRRSHRDESSEKSESMYTVVIGLAEERLGIVVDSLLGQKEIVIKSLGEYFGALRGIAGSTILGDGRVIMIIDVAELMKMCVETNN